MTIYQIEAFLTLASTLNYTKASSVLHTTQPNLTKMIINLERELGITLLFRNKRDVKLTPAGRCFCEEMKRMMEHYHHSVNKAKEIDLGISGSLDVGFLGTALLWQLPAIVNQFRKKHPRIALNLADFTYQQLIKSLEDDSVDIALMPDHALEKIPNLLKRQIFEDDMCLVVGKNHPLANKQSLDLSAAKDESFVMMDPKISQADWNLVSNICVEQGFIPKAAHEANTLNGLMLMIECGNDVSILAKHMTHFATENVSFIKINGYENYFRVSCVWRKDVNPSISCFLDVIEDTAMTY